LIILSLADDEDEVFLRPSSTPGCLMRGLLQPTDLAMNLIGFGMDTW
jgi:hypothetical protein